MYIYVHKYTYIPYIYMYKLGKQNNSFHRVRPMGKKQ